MRPKITDIYTTTKQKVTRTETKTHAPDFLERFYRDSQPRKKFRRIHRLPLSESTRVFLYFGVALLCVLGIPRALSSTLDSQYPVASIFSSTMAPTLHPGDLIFIRGVSAAEPIEQGDIIVWQDGVQGSIVVHRVEEVGSANGRTTIITKGDGLATQDPPITSDDVVGKTVTWPEPLPWAGKPVRLPVIGKLTLLGN